MSRTRSDSALVMSWPTEVVATAGTKPKRSKAAGKASSNGAGAVASESRS